MTSGHPPLPDPPHGGPPDDRAGHPDLDALADLDAGLPDPISTARLDEHVAGCPACTQVLRALAAVRVELRALPPPQLPAGVAARLDATVAELRAAEPVSATSAAAGVAPPPGDSGGNRPTQRPPPTIVIMGVVFRSADLPASPTRPPTRDRGWVRGSCPRIGGQSGPLAPRSGERG